MFCNTDCLRSGAEHDPKAATNQLLRSIDKPGVTVWNNELKKFEHNGAAKHDQEDQALMPAMVAQQRKHADVSWTNIAWTKRAGVAAQNPRAVSRRINAHGSGLPRL